MIHIREAGKALFQMATLAAFCSPSFLLFYAFEVRSSTFAGMWRGENALRTRERESEKTSFLLSTNECSAGHFLTEKPTCEHFKKCFTAVVVPRFPVFEKRDPTTRMDKKQAGTGGGRGGADSERDRCQGHRCVRCSAVLERRKT